MTTAVRYQFNGLFCPKANDFLPPQEELVRVPEFLEACCVRLERLFPDTPHVASLVKEMREFGTSDGVKSLKADADEEHKYEISQKDDRIDELEHEVGALKEDVSELQWQVAAPAAFDESLPE